VIRLSLAVLQTVKILDRTAPPSLRGKPDLLTYSTQLANSRASLSLARPLLERGQEIIVPPASGTRSRRSDFIVNREKGGEQL